MEEQTKDTEKVLSDEILTDARRRAERTVKRAETEGRKLLEQALAEAGAAGDAERREVERRLARDRQVFEASLLQEERMRRLAAQGKLIDEAFAEALKRLASREGGNYPKVVRDLAVEAILAMRGDAFVLRLAKTDADALRPGLPGEVAAAVREKSGRAVTVTVSGEAGAFDAGVVVEAADGRQRVDNSFAGRLRRLRGELRFDVADALFGPPVSPGTGKEDGTPKDTSE